VEFNIKRIAKNVVKYIFCESIASTHFKLMQYDISKIGIENIAGSYCNIVKDHFSDAFNESIKTYIQNLPDFLLSKPDKDNLLSIFLECKYLQDLPDLRHLLQKYLWQYRNLLIRNQFKKLVIKDLVEIKFNGNENEDIDIQEFKYSEELDELWEKYTKKAVDNCDKVLYDKYIEYYFRNVIVHNKTYEEVRLPILFYVISKNISVQTLETYCQHLDDEITKWEDSCKYSEGIKNQIICDTYFPEELKALRDWYKHLIANNNDIPCVFVAFSHFPFWVPANSEALKIYNNGYFNELHLAYCLMQDTIKDILDFKIVN
jgi:hypothetical protein